MFAKDIALLPDWQQQIWVGFNIAPEGGISKELHAAQVKATPASTQAPEKFLISEMRRLDNIAKGKLKTSIFRDLDPDIDLLKRTHRFRATDNIGLYALAKDIERIVIAKLDKTLIKSVITPPPDGKDWGSIKLLENMLASKIGDKEARKITAPLVGINELRIGDAHEKSEKGIKDALELVGIDAKAPSITQGYQLLDSCVSTLSKISKIIENWDK